MTELNLFVVREDGQIFQKSRTDYEQFLSALCNWSTLFHFSQQESPPLRTDDLENKWSCK